MGISFAPGSEKRITPSGTELSYYDVGSGKTTVVLLHGLFGNPSNWLPIMHRLQDQYRFLALQLPIDAASQTRRANFDSLRQLTDHVALLFDELDLDRAVVGGNSLGGQVALDFCLSNPDRVEGLVLAGSAGLFERNLAGGNRPRLCRDFIREQAHQIFYDPKVVSDDFIDEIYTMLSDRPYRKMMLRVAKSTRDRYMLDELRQVDAPTLIVWGRDDTITPPFVAEQFRDNIRNSRRIFIEQCGHAPPIEQPTQFADALDEFLSDLSPAESFAPVKPR